MNFKVDKSGLVCLAIFTLFAGADRLTGQALRVDARNLYERTIAIVPIVGAGTYKDPKRPLFAPANAAEARLPNGIRSFEWQPSDDGKLAIVEFVARNKTALRPVLTDSRVVKAFEKGKFKKEDIEKEIRKYKKNYRFDKDRWFGGAR